MGSSLGVHLCANRRLVFAVLRRAIWDFALYKDLPESHANHQLAVDAAEWLFWDGEDMVPAGDSRFTFLLACEVLGLDPEVVRYHARSLSRADIQRTSDSDIVL